VIDVTEDQRRQMIVRCARDCEGALYSADAVARVGTVRERLTSMAFHLRSAEFFSAAAFTWANCEVTA
jgi:hypothetical protein